jgi:hypothetical protein
MHFGVLDLLPRKSQEEHGNKNRKRFHGSSISCVLASATLLEPLTIEYFKLLSC